MKLFILIFPLVLIIEVIEVLSFRGNSRGIGGSSSVSANQLNIGLIGNNIAF